MFIMTGLFLPEQIQLTFFVGHMILAVLGLLLFLAITLLMERLVPEYKPLVSTLTLIKNQLRRSGQSQMEGVC